MDNVYDAAHALAESIAISPEGKRFRYAQEQLKADPESFKLAQEFFPQQLAIQTRQMMGQTISPEEITAFNTLATSVMGNKAVAEYLQAQMAFMPIYQDILKIINDAVGMDTSLFGLLGR